MTGVQTCALPIYREAVFVEPEDDFLQTVRPVDQAQVPVVRQKPSGLTEDPVKIDQDFVTGDRQILVFVQVFLGTEGKERGLTTIRSKEPGS